MRLNGRDNRSRRSNDHVGQRSEAGLDDHAGAERSSRQIWCERESGRSDGEHAAYKKTRIRFKITLAASLMSRMSREPPKLSRQTRLANFAENVKQKLVCFLNARSGIAGHDKIDIGNAVCRSTVTAEQCDGF